MSHNGRSNAFNWKGFKTPFRRSGHISVFIGFNAYSLLSKNVLCICAGKIKHKIFIDL